MRREQVERRNKLDNLCYTLEKSLNENKVRLEAADVSSLEALIKEAREAVEKQDDAVIKSVGDRLEKEAHRMATTMYQAAGDASSARTDAAPKAADDTARAGGKKVVDAEFEETPGAP